MALKNSKVKLSNDMAIQVSNLSKTFKIPKERKSQLKQYFLNPFHRPEFVKFDALKNVSFEVKKGEFLGIIGRNGSGKSTMLKILAGVYQPSEGKVKINGKITPFLELGVGFNPELSARENIYLNGTILGMTRKYLLKKFDEIVDFAEIREFIDMPVKNYSSGMQVRLAFAIAIQSDADTYLVDEVLAVGDANFQEKCFDVFRRFKKEGKTVVFVSHDLGSIELFCDKVIWIDMGQKKDDGLPKDTIFQYLSKEKDPEKLSQKKETKKDYKVVDIRILDSNLKPRKVFKTGEELVFELRVNVSKVLDDLYLGFAMFDKHTNCWICGNNSYLDEFKPKWKKGLNKFLLRIPNNQFNKGSLSFLSSLFTIDNNKKQDILDMYNSLNDGDYIKVLPNNGKSGLLQLPHTWENVEK